jgi:hypothetical protein
MDHVPDHEERLEWNHHFVIFHIIANEHKKFLGSHDEYSPEAIVPLLAVNIAMPALFPQRDREMVSLSPPAFELRGSEPGDALSAPALPFRGPWGFSLSASNGISEPLRKDGKDRTACLASPSETVPQEGMNESDHRSLSMTEPHRKNVHRSS